MRRAARQMETPLIGRPQAVLYRMVMDKHLCPFGLKAKTLLEREGYHGRRPLAARRRAETDAFKAERDVKTTPQIFIDGTRIGGYDDLRRFLGKKVRDPKALTYKPGDRGLRGDRADGAGRQLCRVRQRRSRFAPAEWFIAFSMCVLAILKLRDVESFSSMFLGYDLLARRWVPYAYIYPVRRSAWPAS